MANFLELIIIIVAIISGLIISVEDFKFSKIPNKWIKLGFIVGLAVYFLQLLYFVFTKQPIFWQAYLLILLNTVIAFILSFTLWNFKLWAGGDAKLFTLYAFLIPLSYYQNAYFKYWPALTLLINIILPIFIYLLIKFLIYPLKLFVNYLKTPKLFKEYFYKFKAQNKFDKSKIKEYLSYGVSFLVILIFFQILRTRLNEFISPYLGNLVTLSYFAMSMVIFQPLRVLLKKYTLIVAGLVVIYFILGYFYFPVIAYADLHKVFALQMIIVMSYFYILKYGQIVGSFLYNSSEVQMIPISEIKAGIYLNKSHLQKLMGSRLNLNDFKAEVEPLLELSENEQLFELIKTKTDDSAKKQYRLISLLRNLRLDALPKVIIGIWQAKKEQADEKVLLEKIRAKLSVKQQADLDYLLSGSDEVSTFLKEIKGKLTALQAETLRAMIENRNQEISQQGHPAIEQIILHKTFSFAPFMLLGVIITLLTKSSLIHLFYQYILGK